MTVRGAAAITFVVVAVAGQLAVGMRAANTASITGDEPFYLLTTQSLASDGDLDLRDEYAGREYRKFWDGDVALWSQMEPTRDGRLLSPHDPGLALLVLPAYEVGGLRGVQRFLVLLWAAAMALAVVVACRLRAPPWAAVLGGVVAGAACPGIVYASQVYPEGPAALCVAIGLLLVVGRPVLAARTPRIPRGFRGQNAVGLAVTLTALAWLGVKYVPVGAVLGAAWAWRRRDDRVALATAAGLLAVAGVHYVWWHLHTFGGITPYATNLIYSGEGSATIVSRHVGWTGRSYRLYGLFLDARFGLFRWLPVAVLALWGVTRRTVVPAAVFVVGILMGAFVSITMMGWWFPGRMLIAGFAGLAVLIAVGAARLPRVAVALAGWSLAVALALVWSARTGGVRLAVDPFTLGFPLPPAALFPDFRSFGARQVLLSASWAVALTMGLWRSSSFSMAIRWPTGRSSRSRRTWRPLRAR